MKHFVLFLVTLFLLSFILLRTSWLNGWVTLANLDSTVIYWSLLITNGISGLIFWIWTINDAVKKRKPGWVLLLLIGNIVASIIYFLFIFYRVTIFKADFGKLKNINVSFRTQQLTGSILVILSVLGIGAYFVQYKLWPQQLEQQVIAPIEFLLILPGLFSLLILWVWMLADAVMHKRIYWFWFLFFVNFIVIYIYFYGVFQFNALASKQGTHSKESRNRLSD